LPCRIDVRRDLPANGIMQRAAHVCDNVVISPGDILKFSRNGSQTVFASGSGQPQGNGGPEFLTFHELLIL